MDNKLLAGSIFLSVLLLPTLVLADVTTVTLESPASGSYINASSYSLVASLSIVDTDSRNVTFWLGDLHIGTVENDTEDDRNFTLSWDLNGTADGVYSFSAKASNSTTLDAATDTNTNVTIDRTSPLVSISSPQSDQTLNGTTIWINGSVSDTNKANNAPSTNLTDFALNGYSSSSGSFSFKNSSSVQDGSYAASVSFRDDSGNSGSVSRAFKVDNTPPVISFSLDKTSVNKGETITASCTATDSVDATPTVTFTANPPTDTTGTKNTTCTAEDDSGNLATKTLEYDVRETNNDDDGGGGGGGSGGGSSGTGLTGKFTIRPEVHPNQTKTIPQTTPGETVVFEVTNPELGIERISINVSNPSSDVDITIIKLDEESVFTKHLLEDAYGYFEINATNLSEEDVDRAEIVFVVESGWLDKNNLNESEVALYRYEGDEWIELPTKNINGAPDVARYAAQTPGLSYFAIAPKGARPVPVPGGAGILLLVVLIAGIGLIYYFARKR